eukprot:1729623-Prymnesium_polylepis.1
MSPQQRTCQSKANQTRDRHAILYAVVALPPSPKPLPSQSHRRQSRLRAVVCCLVPGLDPLAACTAVPFAVPR